MLQCLWLTTDTFHWAADAPALPMPCSAQVRYRQAAAPCVAHDAGHGKVRVDFHEPMLAVVADAVAAAEPAAGYRKLADAVTSGAALKARRAASTVLGGATTVLTEFLDQMEAQ